MAKYTFKIEAGGVDISNAVLAGFSITNGRNILTQGFVQWSASLSAFKKEIQSILATAGKDPDFLAPGTELKISVKTAPTTWLTMFRGIITNTSAQANQYNFTAIDEVYFGFVNNDPFTLTLPADLDATIQATTGTADGPFMFDTNASVTYPRVIGLPPSSDVSSVVDQYGRLAKYTFLELFLPDDRVTFTYNSKDRIKVGQLSDVDISTVDVTIQDADIDESYSITRNTADLYNVIEIEYTGGRVATATDITSVKQLGSKRLEIDSTFGTNVVDAQIAAKELAEALLQQHGLWGFALINFRTSADRLGLSVENTVKKVFPKKVIDSSAVTAPEFQAKMVIQEVEHRCSPDYWEIGIVAANYRFVTEPQTWAEVSSSLTWANVPDYLTWDMIRTKDL